MKTKIKLYIEIDSKHSDKKIYYFVDILKNHPQVEMVDQVELAESYFIVKYGPNNPWNQSKSRLYPKSLVESSKSFYAFYNQFCIHYELYTEFSVEQYINLLKLSNSSDKDSRLLAHNLWLKLPATIIMNLGLYLINRHGQKDDRSVEIFKALQQLCMHNHVAMKYDGLSLDTYYDIIHVSNKQVNKLALKIMNDDSIQQLFTQKYAKFLKFPKISLIGLEDDKVQSTYDKSQITKEFGI